MKRKEFFDAIMSESFIKITDYPESYKTKDNSIFVTFDTYFHNNFDVSLSGKFLSFGVSDGLYATRLAKHIRG